MTSAFVILLTFAIGPAAHGADRHIDCPNQACVDRVVAAAQRSTHLARLRVYRGDPGNIGNGATVSAPLRDEWFT